MESSFFEFDKILLLGSKSPRRKEIIEQMGIPYRTVDISFDESKWKEKNALTLSRAKMMAYKSPLDENEILLTADTLVIADNRVLGKPADNREAMEMLERLSGGKHRVVTGVCMKSAQKETCFEDATMVYFRELTREEMCYYIREYGPLDKAGAYGIQEWIGLTGIYRIEGNYHTVVGLPASRVWEEWLRFNDFVF